MAKAPVGLAHLLLGQPDLAEALMRSLGLKGALPQYIESEFNASISALDLADPEYLWLRRTQRYQQTLQVGPVAAQFSQIVFAPVAGAPRTLAVLEKVIITNSQAAAAQNFIWDFYVDAVTGFAPAAIPKSGFDDRGWPFNTGQPVPAFGLINATGAAAKVVIGGGSGWISLPASTSFVLDVAGVFTARSITNTPAPLFFAVAAQAVNLPLTATFIWRERAMLASEQT